MLAFAAEQKAPGAITLRGLFPLVFLRLGHIITSITGKPVKPYMGEEG